MKITKAIKQLFNSAIPILAAIFFAQILLTPNAAAQIAESDGGGTFYAVSGNVRADGVNLENAAVVLLFDSNIVESTTTDANGNYSLNALEGFSYTASVYKDGYNFNPSYQILNNVQTNLTVNFLNGTLLCAPASCQNAVITPVSTIENGKIAFEMFSSTFAIDPDGTNQMQLPPAGAFPSWSPDGTKLLYNRTTSFDPDHEIYITNADGTGNRQITINFVNDYKAQWSPDGTRAVFFRFFNSSDIEIFTINTDSPNNGINEVQLTNDATCINRDPSYSPDGAKIVFAKFCENENLTGIYTMDAADGENEFQLTSGGLDLSPAWRPDGNRIIFVRDGDFWTVNPSGTGAIQQTFDLQFDYFSPVYSPDGTKIAFSRAASQIGFREIYTLNPFSGEQIRLTNSEQNKEYPSWQKVIADVSVTLVGGLNLTFSNVTNAGNTVATPIEPNSAGALPSGFRLIPESFANDIRTSANFTGETEICFDVMNINDPQFFTELVIFHNENGALVDRTSSRDFDARRICATTASVSPFVLAAPDAPSAASVTVAGRILTNNGNGLANATVFMTDSFGNIRSARTSSFGYYSFEEVEVGQTYVFSVSSRRYAYAKQVVAINDEVNNLNFYAIE